MIQDNITKIFLEKYLKKEYNVNGLILRKSITNDLRPRWILSNPNDLSYNKNVLVEFLKDIFEDFEKLTSRRLDNRLTIDIDCDLLYISTKDQEKINNICKNIKWFTFRHQGDDYDIIFSFDSKIINWDLKICGPDCVQIDVDVKVNNPKLNLNGNIKKFNSEKDLVNFLDEFTPLDAFYDRGYHFLDTFQQFIWTHPTLFDNSTFHSINSVNFILPSGEYYKAI